MLFTGHNLSSENKDIFINKAHGTRPIYINGFYGGTTMRLTSKGRYAIRAMLDLANNSTGNPVRLQEISTRQNISLHYLEQLFRKLRNGQAVKSVRGPGGGYILSRAADELTVKHILECVGENISPAKDILGSESETSNSVEYNLSKDYFINMGTIMDEYLASTSLGDLTRRSDEVKTRLANEAEESQNKVNVQQEELSPFASAIRQSLGEVNQ